MSLAGLSLGSSAATAEAIRVGFYDLRRVTAESERIREIKASFQTKRDAKSNELQMLHKQIQDALRASAEAAIGVARQAVRTPATERAGAVQKELLNLRKDEDAALEGAVAEAVKTVSRRRGFGLVLEMTQAGVAWGEDELDLTRSIIEWLDRKR